MASPESVLITGCSDGGIGSALAIAFQARGLRVFATARNTSKMAALSSLSNVILLTLDVTNSVQIAAAVKVVEGETGGVLDYLVNNAGRNHFMPMMDENAEIAKAIFDTNVWGSLAVTQAFIPLLIKAKGTVVHNTSISGYVNVPWMGSYAASKRSMEIMSDTMRVELAPFDVKVQALVTSSVKTEGLTYFGNFKLPEDSLYKSIEATIKGRANGAGRPKLMTATDFADAVVPTIIAGSKSKTWPGLIAKVVGFMANWFPLWLTVSLRMGFRFE
ncbi:hypothetical protein MMC10_002776 [Thelotrema lepadinum]|nr:hypothetical protein [Thelotrema lepadinum]